MQVISQIKYRKSLLSYQVWDNFQIWSFQIWRTINQTPGIHSKKNPVT